jgi:hypothetical protein
MIASKPFGSPSRPIFPPKTWTDHRRALLSEAAAGTGGAGFTGAIFGYAIKLEEMRLIQFFASFTIYPRISEHYFD